GKFSFEGLPAGDYLLRVLAPGYAPYEAKLYCAGDSATQLTMRLQRSPAAVAPGKKGPPRDPLPGAGKITWDVRAVEQSSQFDVVKRAVNGEYVIWLIENRVDFPTLPLGYRAQFRDADGVTVWSVLLQFDPFFPHWRAGERNRLFLPLPPPEDLPRVVQ